MSETSKQIVAITDKGGLPAIVPASVEELKTLATIIHSSNLAPDSLNSPEKVFVAVASGMEIGLYPFQALQSIAVINGRPSIWGDAALALVEASGKLDRKKETIRTESIEDKDGKKSTQYIARCEIKRKGKKDPEYFEFSQQDAIKAGLWNKKGPWQTYPKRMLQMRARAFCLRDNFPDVLQGMSVIEETRDYEILSGGPQQKVSIAESLPATAEAADISGHVERETGVEQVQDEVVVEPDEIETVEATEQENETEESPQPDTEPEGDGLPAELAGEAPKEPEPEKNIRVLFHEKAGAAKTDAELSDIFSDFRENEDIESITPEERAQLRVVYSAHLGRIKSSLTEAQFDEKIKAGTA